MNLGDIVILKVPMLGNPTGTVGVCYEEYYQEGCSFIFENGNYDGFSKSEQKDFLFHVDYDIITSSYIFSNVIELSEDFQEGHFKNALLLSELERGEYSQMLRESKIDSIVD